MTHAPFAMFNQTNNNNAMPSSSSFKVKRKRMSWGMDDEEASKHMRVRSPTFQNSYQLPDLMTDHSNSASDDDQMMDTDMDMDNDCNMAMGHSGLNAHQEDHKNTTDHYVYSSGGSGGFLFGPGAEEDEFDEMEMMDNMGSSQFKGYPSLTPHPNPHHFSNASLSSHAQYSATNGNFRPTSPLAAQAFSQSLPAPGRGLMQPAYNGPLPTNASEVEKARNSHGPHCKSIPKLIMSEYPDATTGRRSMWSVCGDCGACEMTQ
ncbi:uncharacterized protein I206_104291 [Kwoniella pini CBS 10737]|uniref:Uncharacterized protein n=1 Tax=Kwoniella pini CBS 10737 TaxID=1296096 RepID=A0A1B9I229_9TREE|nr:uncharacterized protein I206_04132 [Kwoniella pini CBS 10737]OCF49610.1 hypothetical protein I206_04132 [Kwoniella pini CBS 10737]